MGDNVVSFEEACRDRQLAVIAKAWAGMPDAQRAVVATHFSKLATQLDYLVFRVAEYLDPIVVCCNCGSPATSLAPPLCDACTLEVSPAARLARDIWEGKAVFVPSGDEDDGGSD